MRRSPSFQTSRPRSRADIVAMPSWVGGLTPSRVCPPAASRHSPPISIFLPSIPVVVISRPLDRERNNEGHDPVLHLRSHVLEVDRLVVDAFPRRRDVVGKLAGLVDRLVLNAEQVSLVGRRRQPLVTSTRPLFGAHGLAPG